MRNKMDKQFKEMKLARLPHAVSMTPEEIRKFKDNCVIEPEDLSIMFLGNHNHRYFTDMVNYGDFDDVPFSLIFQGFLEFYRDNRDNKSIDELIKGRTFDNDLVKPADDILILIFEKDTESFCDWFEEFAKMLTESEKAL